MSDKIVTLKDIQGLEKLLKTEIGKLSVKIDKLSKSLLEFTKRINEVKAQSSNTIDIPSIDTESYLSEMLNEYFEGIKNDGMEAIQKMMADITPKLTEEEQRQEDIRLEQAVKELEEELDKKGESKKV